jgi:hypothetical protein
MIAPNLVSQEFAPAIPAYTPSAVKQGVIRLSAGLIDPVD